MSLQFVVGRSGFGKSTSVFQKIVEESKQNPKDRFFVIVPDQYTMQTQKDLVTMSPGKGIMNIDVLSLSRLAYRIFEEVGIDDYPVLDDTGKNLILSKIAQDIKDQIPVIGGNLYKQGYIHEVKSAISEFMQYGIDLEDLKNLTEYAANRGALQAKLQDLGVLYTAFLQYIKDHFLTTEETMGLLAEKLYDSKRLKDSVVVLDGFTGFTPVQGRVIESLLSVCKKVYVTLTIAPESFEAVFDKREMLGEQSLFSFTGKSVAYLCKLADHTDTEIEPAWILDDTNVNRYGGKPELAFLERHLFQYPISQYDEAIQNRIQIHAYEDIKSEVQNTCKEICRVLRESNDSYRDIAVITGNLEGYADTIEEEFEKYKIPYFLDRTRGIMQNPFTGYLRSVLEIFMENFSYESVFHYLRSGFADFEDDEVDDLENYVLELGVRGMSAYQRMFSGRTKTMKQKDTAIEELLYLNGLRERLMDELRPIMTGMSEEKDRTLRRNTSFTIKELVVRLYEFLVQNHAEEKLKKLENKFLEQKEYEKAKEYGQIYVYICDLLDQIMELIGTEKMSIVDFTGILEAGLSEIEVGTIPQSVDKIIVGDMERTRLKPIKYLFFLGINDGNIPANSSKGGIISDIDREYLAGSKMELAPTPRQQMYIQKFYLYQNMTKPSEMLFLSYSGMDHEKKSLRPSYLIRMVEDLFPKSRKKMIESLPGNVGEVEEQFALLLRKYSDDRISEFEKHKLMIYTDYLVHNHADAMIEKLMNHTFVYYEGSQLEQAVASVLYGQTILSSVSRMEKYCSCAYAYFLQYGLSLQERQEYGFEDRDIGTIFHGVLELFSKKLDDHGYTWLDFPKEEGEQYVKESLESFCMDYSDAFMYESAVTRYSMQRMNRILNRAVETISYQLKKGKYTPKAYELSFETVERIEDIGEKIAEPVSMRLRGKIDRIDTYEDDEHIYVKVVDYKSGNKDFNLAAFYQGTQLQLVIYMKESLLKMKENYPQKEPVSAAMLYYHVQDPLIDGDEKLSSQMITDKINKALRTKGIVNSDETIISTLDAKMDRKSDVVPVEYKADGSFTASSSVMDHTGMQLLSDYASVKLQEIGKNIVSGEISLNPCEQGLGNSCEYCSFKGVCGFDKKIGGFEIKEQDKMSDEEILAKMQEKVSIS